MKYALVPLGAFAAFFLIPKLFQFLINAHSDTAIVIVVSLVCALFSVGIFVINKFLVNGVNENEG
jgi:hypothetical protein